MNLSQTINHLLDSKDLSASQARALLRLITSEQTTPTQIAALLTALRAKGETPAEISGFIQAMRDTMRRVHAPEAIDVCGTGGDNSGTFNVSSTVAFVVAGCGVLVAKHGNRAASSQSGSADALEALGVNIELTPNQAEEVLHQVGVVFLFAPLYHPTMKTVAQVRKELGISTIFNVLGPLVNPAQVTRQLVGVANIDVAEKLAEAATSLGYRRLVLVTSHDGLDEVSTSSPTTAFIVEGKRITQMTINPQEFGFSPPPPQALLGGQPATNARLIRQVLAGKTGPQRDIVVLNSAVALYAADRVPDVASGITKAQTSIDSGQAQRVLVQLAEKTKVYE